MKGRFSILCVFIVVCILSMTTACKEDDCCVLPPEEITETPLYAKGILVVSEGTDNQFGTVSYLDRETKVVENEIFERVNSASFEGGVQSVNVFNDKVYIVAKDANKVMQANAETFLLEGEVTGLQSPRYFIGIDDDISFVSEWGADGLTGSVAVVESINLNIIDRITTPAGADRMLQVANKVWVLCAGGLGRGNKVVLIDIVRGEILNEIELRWSPRSIVRDTNNKVWVACSGNVGDINDNENGALIRFNTSSLAIEETLDLGATVEDVNFDMVLNADKTMLFYNMDGKVYRQPIGETAIQDTPFIDDSEIVNLHGLSYDTEEGYLYVSDAKDFVGDGEIRRYNGETGVFVDAFEVKVAPSGNNFFQ